MPRSKSAPATPSACLAGRRVRISPQLAKWAGRSIAANVLGAHTRQRRLLPLPDAMNFPAGILEPPFYDARPIGLQLRRDRLGDRARDQPHFDNLGAEFDAEGRLRNLDERGQRPFARPVRPWSPVTMPMIPSPASYQRRAHARREYRRPCRPRRRLRRLSCLLGRTAAPVIAASDRRPRFFLGYAQSRPSIRARRPCATLSRRRPTPRPLPAPDRPQYRRLVCGVRRQARAKALSGAGGPGADLVERDSYFHAPACSVELRLQKSNCP